MKYLDEIARRNQKHWDLRGNNKDRYTQPWLNLDKDLLLAYANNKLDYLPSPYTYVYPPIILKKIVGKDVLCLASGGGQQSVVFGLLGANVTVVDLSTSQLEADQMAADHYGYEINVDQCDMRDLTIFDNESFDLVYQAISIIFVPEVRQVYNEVFRVLRHGKYYRNGYVNPAIYMIYDTSWDGTNYVAKPTPYKQHQIDPEDEKDSIEFRHTLTDVFNGLVIAGFSIEGVWEDPRYLLDQKNLPLGSYEHFLTCFAPYFAVLARKEKKQYDI